MLEFILTTCPNYNVSEESLRNVEIFRNDINRILEVCIKRDHQERYYKFLGRNLNDFEGRYQTYLAEFKLVNSTFKPTNPDPHQDTDIDTNPNSNR